MIFRTNYETSFLKHIKYISEFLKQQRGYFILFVC